MLRLIGILEYCPTMLTFCCGLGAITALLAGTLALVRNKLSNAFTVLN